jgi:hypothetical protein
VVEKWNKEKSNDSTFANVNSSKDEAVSAVAKASDMFYKCQEFGHFARDCQVEKLNAAKNAPKLCQFFGKSSHYSTECKEYQQISVNVKEKPGSSAQKLKYFIQSTSSSTATSSSSI